LYSIPGGDMSLGEIVAIHIACIWVCLIAMHIRLEVLSRRADVATQRMDILSQRLDLASKIWTPEVAESIAKLEEPEIVKPSFWQRHPIFTAVLLFIAVLPFFLMLIVMASL
jgi:hypothetical protein